MAKGKEQAEAGVWNFREVPRDIIVKAKIEAAVEGKSAQGSTYVTRGSPL